MKFNLFYLAINSIIVFYLGIIMYLYTPLDGRSVVVGQFTVSGTGMEFSEPEPVLEEAVGTLLARSVESATLSIAPVVAQVKSKPAPEPQPEPVVAE